MNDVENRSEIVVLYDAQNTNPNGNPLSANNMPRVDADTLQAIVTDVRLKRYIRDQLDDDGDQLYIRNPQRVNQTVSSRDELFIDLFSDEVDSLDALAEAYPDEEDLFEAFLEKAADVRYFGATLSFNEEMQDFFDDSNDVDVGYEAGGSIPQYTGPVQFQHGRSLNQVIESDEAKKLTTVVTSGGDAEQGTFAEDNRLEYALIRFHGVVNESAAEYTMLSQEDVERLDTLIWRAIKNQTLTRSKMGHNPQLYLRAEFDGKYHDGELHHTIQMHDELSKADTEMRSINDVVIDASQLLQRLDELPVERLVINAGKYTKFWVDEDSGVLEPEEFINQLESKVPVEHAEPYN